MMHPWRCLRLDLRSARSRQFVSSCSMPMHHCPTKESAAIELWVLSESLSTLKRTQMRKIRGFEHRLCTHACSQPMRM
eukprot:5140339-Amphidinium_carterae.1